MFFLLMRQLAYQSENNRKEFEKKFNEFDDGFLFRKSSEIIR